MTKENKTIQNQDKTSESKVKKHGVRSIIAAVLCAAVLVTVAIVLIMRINGIGRLTLMKLMSQGKLWKNPKKIWKKSFPIIS